MFRSLILVFACLGGCVNMTTEDRLMVQELEHYGVYNGDFKVKSPAGAGMLSLLPGFGNFYLAAGNHRHGEQWAFGVMNLLLWPLAPIWAIPQCVADGMTINDLEMVYYFRLTEPGRAELARLRQTIGAPTYAHVPGA